MNHMKNQISALSDSFPCPDELSKKKNKTKQKLVWCGKHMAKIFTFNFTNFINYTLCILHISQDYFFLYYQEYDWASNENKDEQT